MSTECENCKGVGLVSTGAVPHDLSVGTKVTCSNCVGTGRVEPVQSEAQPEGSIGPTSGQMESAPESEEGPKAEDLFSVGAGGEGSSELSETGPKVGDTCEREDGRLGTLQRDENGWVCVANEA